MYPRIGYFLVISKLKILIIGSNIFMVLKNLNDLEKFEDTKAVDSAKNGRNAKGCLISKTNKGGFTKSL